VPCTNENGAAHAEGTDSPGGHVGPDGVRGKQRRGLASGSCAVGEHNVLAGHSHDVTDNDTNVDAPGGSVAVHDVS